VRRLAGSVGACAGLAGGAAAQQSPAPAPPDSARGDTARARRDSVRGAPSDSTQRDSVIARQLRGESRQTDPVYHRFAPDRLRLTAVGASAGMAVPDQVRPAPVYALHADYGELAPNVRALFGVTFWSSRVRDAAVDAFVRAASDAVGGRAAPAAGRVGRVRSSDVALNADLRWRPAPLRQVRLLGLRPWVSGGVGVHLLDVQGAPISDTFVERALDGVSFGVAGAAGADVTVFPTVQLTAQARYDLFSGAHFASARAGASYVLDRRGRP
jgi:hypothetical protein